MSTICWINPRLSTASTYTNRLRLLTWFRCQSKKPPSCYNPLPTSTVSWIPYQLEYRRSLLTAGLPTYQKHALVSASLKKTTMDPGDLNSFTVFTRWNTMEHDGHDEPFITVRGCVRCTSMCPAFVRGMSAGRRKSDSTPDRPAARGHNH